MVKHSELLLQPAWEIREGTSGRLKEIGAGNLAIIAICALGITLVGNSAYECLANARANHAFMEKTRPSDSYLTARRSPPIDYAVIDDVAYDLSLPYDETSITGLLGKVDQCWKSYDHSPSWEQLDYCAAYDIGVMSIVPKPAIQAYARLSGYPSADERRTEAFLRAKANPLDGEHVVVQRVNDIALTIQINNR